MTTTAIVGRDDELGRIDAYLDRVEGGPTALLLEGEAGAGKSTLWNAGVASAQRRGRRVLSSRPTEAERGLPHVVLGDLLEHVVDDVLPELPAPRRRALEDALLLGPEPETELDPRAIGVALRTCFEILGSPGPLLVAVDDFQWADPSSADALRFALRRLRVESFQLLIAVRLERGEDTAGFDGILAPDALVRVPVGPLSLGALRAVTHERLGMSLARPTLLRLHEVSGGNPFYALELARAFQDAAEAGDPLEPFPIPGSLDRLVGTRLAALGDETREPLLLVAAHGRPTVALLEAAGVASAALEPAIEAHVVEVSHERARFTHPLLASVLYHGAPEEERRKAHARLAAVVDDSVERARHLARSTDSLDAEVAVELEAAAATARARGTIAVAAELADRALRATHPAALADRQRRGMAATRCHLDAADVPRARSVALDVVAAALPPERAEALLLLSDVERVAGHVERAVELQREALAEAEAAGQPAVEWRVHVWLARGLRFTEGAAAADRHAVRALELATELGDEAMRARSLTVLATGRFREGDPDALRLLDEAERATPRIGDPAERLDLSLHAVLPLVWSYELGRAQERLEAIDVEWGDRDEITASDVLWWQAMIDLRAGRLAAAAKGAERSREIVLEYTGEGEEEPNGVWLVSLIAVHRGHLERARALAEQNLLVTAELPLLRSGDEGVLGLVEHWGGRPELALPHYAIADEARLRVGVREPSMFWWRADYIEALIACESLAEATALLDGWEAEAARLGRVHVLAQATRCRGIVVAASGGDLGNACAELERAVELHAEVGDAFGRARSLLSLGTMRRRARERRAAREAIQAAVVAFEECGAELWAQAAGAELGRIGGRTRSEGLTPSEERIAVLVAEGRTNREVAASLFLTEHTVATSLTRIYRKLGVRSRAELAHRFGDRARDADQAKT